MSRISTHILDTSAGKPAAGVNINLSFLNDRSWIDSAEGITDKDGRINSLLNEGTVREKGIYKIKFMTGEYFKNKGLKNFYPYVEIIFEIDSDEHYHIPLLISPFGYSTYRGS
jgi:5-hydroxyisourate hydrolase